MKFSLRGRCGLVWLAIASALASANLSAHEADGTLRFGTSLGYPPFEYRGAGGQIEGFEIDLGNAICAHLHKRCEWVETEISTMVPAINGRKFDAVLASLEVTEARQKQMLFTDKVYVGSSRMIARAGSALRPDPASLAGKHVGVELGSIEETFAKQRWAPRGVDVVSYNDPETAYSDLMNGRLDSILTTEVQGQLGFLGTARGKGFAFAGGPLRDLALGSGVSAIGVARGNAALAGQLNSALAALHADGTYQRIAAKYFPPSIDIYGR